VLYLQPQKDFFCKFIENIEMTARIKFRYELSKPF